LVQAGAITADKAAEWAVNDRYPPDVVQSLHAYWSKPVTTSSTNTYVAKAQARLWTDSQNAYIKNGEPRSVVEPAITVLVPDLADRDAIFQLWDDTRAVNGGTVPGA
jgi:hypothetical protein